MRMQWQRRKQELVLLHAVWSVLTTAHAPHAWVRSLSRPLSAGEFGMTCLI